jgi:hypothetical protein
MLPFGQSRHRSFSGGDVFWLKLTSLILHGRNWALVNIFHDLELKPCRFKSIAAATCNLRTLCPDQTCPNGQVDG